MSIDEVFTARFLCNFLLQVASSQQSKQNAWYCHCSFRMHYARSSFALAERAYSGQRLWFAAEHIWRRGGRSLDAVQKEKLQLLFLRAIELRAILFFQ